jgi:hypothetical protein
MAKSRSRPLQHRFTRWAHSVRRPQRSRWRRPLGATVAAAAAIGTAVLTVRWRRSHPSMTEAAASR